MHDVILQLSQHHRITLVTTVSLYAAQKINTYFKI